MNLWQYNKKELHLLKPEQECYYTKKNSKIPQVDRSLLASLYGWVYNGPFFSPVLMCFLVNKSNSIWQIKFKIKVLKYFPTFQISRQRGI